MNKKIKFCIKYAKKKKLIHIMKNCLIFIVLGIGTCFANESYSQKTFFTFEYNNQTVKEVIREIEQTSEYIFFYLDNSVDLNRKVSVKADNEQVEKILDQIFAGTLNKYHVSDRQIIISSEKAPEQPIPAKVEEEQQTRTITGVVRDEDGPVAGANVIVKGTSNGTATDVNGQFTLSNIPPNAVLVVSYIGYVSQEVNVTNQTSLNITIYEDAKLIDEVVVVGFGTQKKVNLTGAVSVIDSKALEDRPVSNVVQALQGTITGLTVNNSAGGGVSTIPTISVRGLGTIGQGSSGNPLVLIDGMEGDINAINPQDIDNISILKDAAASSVYGTRAPFGVILITTKKGKAGKPVITYNGNYRITTPTKLPDTLDSYTWALMFNEMHTSGGGQPFFTQEWLQLIQDFQAGKLMHEYNGKLYPQTTFPWVGNEPQWNSGYNAGIDNVDVFRTVFKTQTYAHEHNLSVSGGTDNMKYYLSGNILDAPGFMKLASDHQSRVGLTARISTDITKFLSVSYTTRFTRSEYDQPRSTRGRFDAYIGSQGWPTLPVYDPNGYIFDNASPYFDIVYGGREDSRVDRIVQQFNATFEPVKGWKFIGDFNYSLTNSLVKQVKPIGYLHDVDGNPYPYKDDSFVIESFGTTGFTNINVFSEYTKEIAGHTFKILAGFQSELNKNRAHSVRRDGIQVESNPTINTTTGLSFAGSAITPAVSGSLSNWATAGYFGRINYDYQGKYLLEANLRYDGTSRFRSDKRWTLLPSFSAGWNVAREEFWGGLSQYVSSLKIRGSYGELGNTNLSSWYPTYLTMLLGSSNSNWIVDGRRLNVANAPDPISISLTWEKIRSYNGGIDVSSMKNRLNTSFDYFVRFTDDMVGPAPTLPAVFGATVPRTNNTSLKTVGTEFEVSWQDRLSFGMNYGIRFTVSDSKTTILDYPNEIRAIGYTTSGAQITYNNYNKGETWGNIWGYTTIGIAKTQEEMDAHLAKVDQSPLNPGSVPLGAGDIMYKDINGDGKIDAGANTLNDPGDRSVIGNITPRGVFGLNLTADWQGIDFRIFFQGVMKRDYFVNHNLFWGSAGTWSSYYFKQHMDYFRDDPNHPFGLNVNSYYPRISGRGSNKLVQTRYLQNAAYIRLQNLTFGYTLPKNISRKVYLDNVRFFLSGENLWVGTKLSKIFDPETVANSAGNSYPLYKAYSIGLSIAL